mgnify:CR=1 FL=1
MISLIDKHRCLFIGTVPQRSVYACNVAEITANSSENALRLLSTEGRSWSLNMC